MTSNDNTPDRRDDRDDTEREHIGGKTFERTPPGAIDPETLAKASAAFEQLERDRAQLPPDAPRGDYTDAGGAHEFDGTEFEDWARQRHAERQAEQEDR